MTSVHFCLSELELDALTELANVGVSQAAGSLRNMIGEEVFLSVPSVKLITQEVAAGVVIGRGGEKLVGIHQSFNGDLSGGALLIFPETNSLELVRAVVGSGLPIQDIVELEQEALAETGNIILNSCIATMANMLNCTMRTSLPEVLRGTWGSLLGSPVSAGSGESVLFMYINFVVKQRDISGYIAMMMQLPALESLRARLGTLIAQTADEAL